jgi:hypothetical protein
MNPYSKLESWLYTATRTLAQPQTPRAELRAHLLDLVETLEQSGISQSEAEGQALERMGSALDTAQQLERVHLTQVEVEFLEGLQGKNTSPHVRILIWSFVGLMGVLALILWSSLEFSALEWGLFALLGLMGLYTYWMKRRVPFYSTVLETLLAYLMVVLLMLVQAWRQNFPSANVDFWIVQFVAFMVPYTAFQYSRLVKAAHLLGKLRRLRV